MKLLFCILFSISLSAAPAPERVLTIVNGDLTSVQNLLNEGWTVKHQSVAASAAAVKNSFEPDYRLTIYLFTLTPPPPEVIAENEVKRAAEFAKKREEYLAKMRAAKVEK